MFGHRLIGIIKQPNEGLDLFLFFFGCVVSLAYGKVCSIQEGLDRWHKIGFGPQGYV